MTPLVLCPRYEQGEAERGGPGAESRSWQRDSGEQGVGQRPQNRHSAPGPANPRHPPRPPHTSRRNFLAGKGLWERRRWTPAPSPPGNQLEPRVLSRGQGSSGAPPPKGSPASQALGSCRQTGGGVAPGTQCPWHGGQPPHHKGPFVLPPLALKPRVTSPRWAQGPDCGLNSPRPPQSLGCGFEKGLLSPGQTTPEHRLLTR